MKRIIRLTESDLTRIVRRVISERSLLTEGVPNTSLKSETSITIPARTVCGGIDYIKGSVILQNTGTEDAYINVRPSLKAAGVPELFTSNEYNVTIGGKPVWGNPEGQNQVKIPKGKKATLNFVIGTNIANIYADYTRELRDAQTLRSQREKDAAKAVAIKKRDDRYNAFKNIQSANLVVRYNGQPLEIPVNFGGFMVDGSRSCDTQIMLPKGF
jgi:hypothetical protein